MTLKNQEIILITGGAGFIGSHMVQLLLANHFKVIILDNLSTGHAEALLGEPFMLGDLGNKELVQQIFRDNHITAVMHFASFIEVKESVYDPQKYYLNNVVNTLNLLQVMLHHKVNKFIFSSSAAVYGNPISPLITENHGKAPTNPYGQTKWVLEQILQDYSHAYGLNAISLRYFNAAGCDPGGKLGENHHPETHLIPLLLQVANREREFLTIYGNDYPTKDGTCIRDFIHVMDLCEAHFLALKALLNGAKTNAYNLGTGFGYSVNEIVESVKKETHCQIPIVYGPRRAGDPDTLVADPAKAIQELGWKMQFSLSDMIQHAWQYRKNHSNLLECRETQKTIIEANND
jgi:UDP-glucose 4-epimerase